MIGTLPNKIRNGINRRFDKWLKKRIPAQNHHQLNNKNIFILPSKFGVVYLFFVLLLFIFATNYQNNVIMLMTFLLGSFFITIMLHSFFNLSGLSFQLKQASQGFVNQTINIPITINARKDYFDLHIQIHNNSAVTLQKNITITADKTSNNTFVIPVKTLKRGVTDLGRLKISSEYSFGLFVTWALLDFSHTITIYPQPKPIKSRDCSLFTQEKDELNTLLSNKIISGIEDFHELKQYVVGEANTKIAWKQYARGQGKLTKHYQDYQGSTLWLRLSEMPNTDIEEKLCFLCYLVLEYSQKGYAFGLDLEFHNHHVTIDVNQGLRHKFTCLKALACFPKMSVNDDK